MRKPGRYYWSVDRFDNEFLYVNSLPGGVGSNDLGMDRSAVGEFPDR